MTEKYVGQVKKSNAKPTKKTGEMVQKPTKTNGSKYVYRVTDGTGQYREGYGDAPSDAVCNCQWIADKWPLF